MVKTKCSPKFKYVFRNTVRYILGSGCNVYQSY